MPSQTRQDRSHATALFAVQIEKTLPPNAPQAWLYSWISAKSIIGKALALDHSHAVCVLGPSRQK